MIFQLGDYVFVLKLTINQIVGPKINFLSSPGFSGLTLNLVVIASIKYGYLFSVLIYKYLENQLKFFFNFLI